MNLIRTDSNVSGHRRDRDDGVTSPISDAPAGAQEAVVASDSVTHSATPSRSRWRSLARGIPMPRVGHSHKEEKPDTTDVEGMPKEISVPRDDNTRWDFRSRFEELVVTQAERLRERIRPDPDTDSLPVTVIPAPPRRGAALAQLREVEEFEMQRSVLPRGTSGGSGTSPTEDGSSPDFSHQYRVYNAGPAVAYTAPAPGELSVFGGSLSKRRSTRNQPVTIIPAPPRRETEVAPATLGTPHGDDCGPVTETRAGPSSP